MNAAACRDVALDTVIEVPLMAMLNMGLTGYRHPGR